MEPLRKTETISKAAHQTLRRVSELYCIIFLEEGETEKNKKL
jgi:hypothetical protein